MDWRRRLRHTPADFESRRNGIALTCFCDGGKFDYIDSPLEINVIAGQ